MSFGGRLETLELSALLQTLSVGVASGRLTLTRLDRHAVLVLRGGRVVYASGGSAGETLAGRLLREKLVGEAELMKALERQHDGTGFRRLGDVLVEMGLLAEGTLQAVVRRRMEELVGELLAWKSGFFRFEPAGAGSDADVEVDLGDFVLPGGVPPQELLMRAVAALDHADLSRLPPAADTARPAAVRGPRGRPRPLPDRVLRRGLRRRGRPVAAALRLAAPGPRRGLLGGGRRPPRASASSACASPAAAPGPRPCARPCSRCASPRSSAPRSNGGGATPARSSRRG